MQSLTKKLAISTELEQLRDEKRKRAADLENLDKEIAHLREMKFEEQSTLLSYTKQIQELDEYIRNAEDNPNFRSALNEELTIDRNELIAIRKEYESLKEEIKEAQNRIDELRY